MKLERVRSFLNEKTSSINKNFQLAELTGTTRRVHRVTTSGMTLYDYDSGSYVILDISGSNNLTINLPLPSTPGLNFTFIARSSPSGLGDAIILCPQHTIRAQQIGSGATITKAVYTFSFGGALVASNVIACSIEGYPLSTTTYSGTSDQTIAAFAAKLADQPQIASAAVTVVGGNQLGADDRNIVITAAVAGVDIDFSDISITGGSSQTNWEIITVTQPVSGGGSGTGTGNTTNLGADSVTLEAAALGGEWIEFISDGIEWFCRATASADGSITLNS